MMHNRLIILCVLFTFTSAGCSSSTRRPPRTYDTVAQDPTRDSDAARRENERAAHLIERGEWDKAEQALKAALVADVTFGPAHNNLGKVYYHAGKYYLAAWEFKYAINLMPHQPEPRNNLGLVLEAVGKLDDAVCNYDAALELQPENPQFIGNAARARIRRGDRNAQVTRLLSDLILCDDRPDWVDWAKEQLTLYQQQVPPVPSTAP